MSTSETIVFDVGPCPCGGGQISKRVVSQDNPWSSVDISYSINCPTCSREWRIKNESLVLWSSETLHNASLIAERAARDALHELLQTIVDNHFADFSAPTKKAEHMELQRLDLTNMSYRQYLEHKRKGGSFCTAVTPLRNRTWIQEAAKLLHVERQLEDLSEAYSQARQVRTHTGTQIVRKRITEPS